MTLEHYELLNIKVNTDSFNTLVDPEMHFAIRVIPGGGFRGSC